MRFFAANGGKAMNRAILRELTDEFADRLVAMGAQREDVEKAMVYVRNVSIASEAEARNDAQFLLEFERIGSDRMGRLRGKSGQAIRKERSKILRKKQPAVAVVVAE